MSETSGADSGMRPVLYCGWYRAAVINSQQVFGKGSPTNISIMLVPPNFVCITTILAGSSQISPMMVA
jgi:hypothetical protein